MFEIIACFFVNLPVVRGMINSSTIDLEGHSYSAPLKFKICLMFLQNTHVDREKIVTVINTIEKIHGKCLIDWTYKTCPLVYF